MGEMICRCERLSVSGHAEFPLVGARLLPVAIASPMPTAPAQTAITYPARFPQSLAPPIAATLPFRNLSANACSFRATPAKRLRKELFHGKLVEIIARHALSGRPIQASRRKTTVNH
jgi:hypothetical protein